MPWLKNSSLGRRGRFTGARRAHAGGAVGRCGDPPAAGTGSMQEGGCGGVALLLPVAVVQLQCSNRTSFAGLWQGHLPSNTGVAYLESTYAPERLFYLACTGHRHHADVFVETLQLASSSSSLLLLEPLAEGFGHKLALGRLANAVVVVAARVHAAPVAVLVDLWGGGGRKEGGCPVK